MSSATVGCEEYIVEEFIQIKEYPDYSINRQGVIKRAARTFRSKQGVRHHPERIIALNCCRGSVEVQLYDSEAIMHCVSVSQLLLTAFGEKRVVYGTIKMYAGHKDSDKRNIAIDNLQWMTKGEIKHLSSVNKGKKLYQIMRET